MYNEKYNYSVLPDCYPEVLHGECHSNFIRKEPCSFGWDFGPSFPTQGLLKSVALLGMTGAVIKDVLVQTEKTSDATQWVVRLSVYLDCPVTEEIVLLNLAIAELGFKRSYTAVLNQGENKVEYDMEMGHQRLVKEWWPSGYGDPNLYKLKV